MKFKRAIMNAVVIAFVAALAGLFAAPPAFAQAPAPARGVQAVETDPITCWWRTSATAVRVGEPFTFALTCSVVETDSVKVIPDQSALEPSVVQLPPFDVIGGTHGPDLRSEDHRFFQYEYRLRLIGDELFGKDVSLPSLKVSYKVQSTVTQGSAVEGGDRSYQLPSEAIRVLTLVPADAPAIREAPAVSFVDIDARVFRANVMLVVGGILFALAALMGILALVRVAERRRARTPTTRQLASDAAILRGVDRELSAIERARGDSGWTGELAGRALAALRIVASYALERPVVQSEADEPTDDAAAPEGCLTVRAGWPRTKDVLVSGSVTIERAVQEQERLRIANRGPRGDAFEELRRAFDALSRAWYGAGGAMDDSGLDEAIATGRALLRHEASRHSWLAMRLAAFKRTRAPQGTRAWVR